MEEWNFLELQMRAVEGKHREFIWTDLIVVVKICYKMISEKSLEF